MLRVTLAVALGVGKRLYAASPVIMYRVSAPSSIPILRPPVTLFSSKIISNLLLLLLLLTPIELSLSGSGPYTNTDKTINNKYT